MKFWCYDDLGHDWGHALLNAAHAKGHHAELFENPRLPDHGVAFVHMHHHPQTRMTHKRAMQTLATNPELTLIPDYRSSVLYDDKLEQLRWLAKWMPHTVVFHTPGRAKDHLENNRQPALPFVSKSVEGTSSHNVRLITDHKQATGEIRLAFSDRGIPQRYGLAQRGYLMWQRFIPNLKYDLRIISVGTKRLVLKRYNREGSSNGRIEPITTITDEIAEALEYANRFFKDEQMPWGGIDVVRDPGNGRWYVLECTVGWNMQGYSECMFIDGATFTKRKGCDVWAVLVEEVERGSFGEIR